MSICLGLSQHGTPQRWAGQWGVLGSVRRVVQAAEAQLSVVSVLSMEHECVAGMRKKGGRRHTVFAIFELCGILFLHKPPAASLVAGFMASYI